MVLVWRGAAAVRSETRLLRDLAEWRDAARVAGLLLDLDAEGFLGPDPRGELAVRAFRWWGAVCGSPATPGAAEIRWRGLRRPDPSKDSVMLVAADGWRTVRALLTASGTSGCGSTADLRVTWETRTGDRPAVVVRGFERGTYRVDDAFRYRRGRGGAQPLTAPVFDPDSVALAAGIRSARLLLG